MDINAYDMESQEVYGEVAKAIESDGE